MNLFYIFLYDKFINFKIFCLIIALWLHFEKYYDKIFFEKGAKVIDKNEWLKTKEPVEDPSPEYIILGDPDKEHREAAWRIAIGLQDVDHLRPSEFLIDIANQNIAGKITSTKAKELVDDYYKKKSAYASSNRTAEADLVASRINCELQRNGFCFSPQEYLSTHYYLFKGIYKHAGQYRDYEIAKSEWVLNGESVNYGIVSRLSDNLKYDIEEEKNFDFTIIEDDQLIKHMAKFLSNLWQNHIFEEGNTRTTAVFFIKYLRNLGFDYINNNMFEKYSWYFRNALVRANYGNIDKGIRETTYYLELFLRNLILGEHNELHNRDIHVNNIDLAKSLQVKHAAQNNMTMYELQVVNAMRNDPEITQDQIAKKIGRSVRTVKTLTKSLSKKGAIKRENGKRYGYWVVNLD